MGGLRRKRVDAVAWLGRFDGGQDLARAADCAGRVGCEPVVALGELGEDVVAATGIGWLMSPADTRATAVEISRSGAIEVDARPPSRR